MYRNNIFLNKGDVFGIQGIIRCLVPPQTCNAFVVPWDTTWRSTPFVLQQGMNHVQPFSDGN